MQNIKLIASDLDGTLLLGGRDTLKEETITLIQKVIDKGMIFAVASGRQYENLRELFGKISGDVAYICYNGGLCVYRGKVIYQNLMDHALALDIIRGIESTPDSRAMVSVKGYELIRDNDESFYRYMTGYVKAKTKRVNDLHELREDIYKVALYNAKERLDAAYFKERYKGKCLVQTSGNVWLDFIPYASDKGTALSRFADALGITRENVLAFGDNDNDLSMLDYAGTPVTMNTAREEIRKHGSFSTDTVDEVLETLL